MRTFYLHTARGVGQIWGELVAAGMVCHFRTCATELNYQKFHKTEKTSSSFTPPPPPKKKLFKIENKSYIEFFNLIKMFFKIPSRHHIKLSYFCYPMHMLSETFNDKNVLVAH